MHIDSHPDIVYSACFNWDGSKLVTTCKDKKIRIYDPRSAELESEAMCHEGSKATRAIFLRHGLIFTTGFNRSSERQYSLRAPDALNEPIVMVELDTSNGVMFPLYDADTNLIYLCGKGDSVIRYFEVRFSRSPSLDWSTLRLIDLISASTGDAGAAVCALHQHVSDAGSAAWHRADAEARL